MIILSSNKIKLNFFKKKNPWSGLSYTPKIALEWFEPALAIIGGGRSASQVIFVFGQMDFFLSFFLSNF